MRVVECEFDGNSNNVVSNLRAFDLSVVGL